MWLSVAAGLVVSLTQTRLLQIPSVRAKFGIMPITAALPSSSLLDTYRFARRYFQQKFNQHAQSRTPPVQKLIKSKSGKASRK